MRLRTLKPTLRTMATGLPVRAFAEERPDATPRERGRRWMRRRARWLAEHPLCEKCDERGRVTAAAEVDHRVPLWKGGADDESNFSSLCRPCHAEKTAAEATDRARAGDPAHAPARRS